MKELFNEIDKGIKYRYGKVTEEISKRINKECMVIEQLQAAQTYLKAKNFIEELKSKGIEVHANVGATCGSIVAYLLGITDIDPILFNLKFERFLNPIRSPYAGKEPLFVFHVQADKVVKSEDFEVVGLRELKHIADYKRLIKEKYAKDIVFNCSHCDDATVYKQISSGCLRNINFLASVDWDVLEACQVTSFADLTAIFTLWRPGTKDFIPLYIQNKQNSEGVKYRHPALKEILGETYGIILYQEQIIDIFHKLAGFSLQDADRIRLRICKRKTQGCEVEREDFIRGCKTNGIDQSTASEIWLDICNYCMYTLCKAHALSQAFVAYQEAWLKANYCDIATIKE